MSTVYLISKEEFESLNKKLDYIISSFNGKVKQEQKEWLNTNEACELLGVGKTTLWTYRNKGKIKASRINRKLYFNRNDIDDLLKGNTT